MLLSLDLGTTHCKAGLFTLDGQLLAVQSRPTQTVEQPGVGPVYDPEALWQSVLGLLKDTLRAAHSGAAGRSLPHPVQAVGITGMAETGLLIDAQTTAPRTALLPWFNRQAVVSVKELLGGDLERQYERFVRTGIWPSFKTSLAKLLWLRQTHPELLPGSLWLSVADYITLRLTGIPGSVPSLAGRTYMFRIDERRWDYEWLKTLGLDSVALPEVHPSGIPSGGVSVRDLEPLGLRRGTPVSIGGHDHICAAYGVHAVLSGDLSGPQPGQVFDSMGTAESLTGPLRQPAPGEPVLGETEYQSGLSFGCHVTPGAYYWLGGLSASGGSLNWLRSILGEPKLEYSELESLVQSVSHAPPSGILFFPYLSGSSSPHTHSGVRAAFTGLDSAHTRADLVKAVLEGTALEMEFIRRTAEDFLGVPIRHLIAAGGSTALQSWMQIKADVSGLPVIVPAVEQAALLGAALLAGQGSGLYGADPGLYKPERETFLPDPQWSERYSDLYVRFVGLQQALRTYSLP